MRSGTVTLAFILVVLSVSSPATAFPATRKLLSMRGRSESHSTIGETHTGTGGGAAGGSVNDAPPCGDDCQGYHPKALIDLFSHNAGDGGNASSGGAYGGGEQGRSTRRWENTKSVGNAYSGAGGQALGGSTNGYDGALINIDSYNAGDGGDANSGEAVGGRSD